VEGGLELARKLALALEGGARWQPEQLGDVIRDLVL
jgi:hypothetical protein